MQRGSALDRLVRRFHDRWETDRQFRSMMSAVLAGVILLSLCSCMLATATVTNAALGGFLGTGSNVPTTGQINADTGTGPLKGAASFPTSTVVFTVGPSPAASPIPASGTPPPTATPAPTATDAPTSTPCNSNCGGGGGGGGGGTLSNVSWSARPTWVPNGNVSITVHSSAGTDYVNFIVNFASGVTMLSYGSYPNGVPTGADGNATYAFQVPGGGCTSPSLTVHVDISSQSGGSTAADIPCG